MVRKIYFEFSFVNPFWGPMNPRKWLLENIYVYLYARQLQYGQLQHQNYLKYFEPILSRPEF